MNDLTDDDALKPFAALAARAAATPAPAVDVRRRVLASLSGRALEPRGEWTMVAVAGLALAASLLVAVWGLDLWSSATDPFGGLLEPLTMVIQ